MELFKRKMPRQGRSSARWCACVLFFVCGFLLLWGSLYGYIQKTGHFFAVYVNGMEIGLLNEAGTLDEMLDDLHAEAAEFYGNPVAAVEEVSVEEVFRPLEDEDREEVFSKLRHLLSFKVEARMITIDGRDVLPVSSEKEREKVVELVAGAYLPDKDNVSLETVHMEEKLSCRPYYCYPEDLYEPETVATVLLNGSDRLETYLVSRGDSLSQIAYEHNITIGELREANPQLNGDLIRVGDELSLIVPEPLVNVKTVERITVEEKIPYETSYTYDSSMWKMRTRVVEPGEHGIKEVTYEVTRVNGAEVEREKISEAVLQEPKTQVVARGTAQVPSRGSGSFIWPVQGGGRITSGYGWRSGGFHAGIDIGARAGTSVLAADSGVVVFAGWDGGYGNSIVIYHGHYYTRYAHNSRNLVSKGEAVNKGQVIATVGSTGRSYGDHLHFEVRIGGIYGQTVNPLNFFRP